MPGHIRHTISMQITGTQEQISSRTKLQTYFFPFAMSKANELEEMSITSKGLKQ